MEGRRSAKEAVMRVPSHTISRPNHIVCPACGSGELQLRGPEPSRCNSCGFSVEDAMFRTLEQIAALPDALGAHACECGHPEMRRLPDRVYHCTSCGSEVLPTEIPVDPKERTSDRLPHRTQEEGLIQEPIHRYASTVRGSRRWRGRDDV